MIDLAELTDGGRIANLSGRHRGLAAMTKFGLDWTNAESVRPMEVIVPDTIDSITPSFIQGMFGKTFEILGHSRDAFYGKFQFRASPSIADQVERGVTAILTSRDLRDIH
ncbi:MAG: hypothetical protein ACTS1Z_14635 [Parasphingopyxis sp.]|uniref:hypothetical protein n=1 Tax=Parasphingopyxis sp. TaxID=1920299 RepID=UPI003F9EFD86